MGEEICYYGNSSGSNYNSFKQNLSSFGIHCPSTITMSLDAVRESTPKSFSWPILAFRNSVPLPKILRSWGELQEYVDDIREEEKIHFRLPTLAAPTSESRNIFVYIGHDFIALHNPIADAGISFSYNSPDLYDGLSKNIVFRLSYGLIGWALDASFDYNDSRILPTHSLRISDLPQHFLSFKDGYSLGFGSDSQQSDFAECYFSNNSYVGDFKTFGIYSGALIRKKMSKLLDEGNLSAPDKTSLLVMKLLFSSKSFDKFLQLANIHNSIVNNESIEVANNIASVLNACLDSKKEGVNVTSYIKIINRLIPIVNGQYTSIETLSPIEIPDEHSSSSVSTVLNCNLSQFRLLSSDQDYYSLRCQLSNSELISKITSGEETYSVITWKNMGNLEFDINIGKGDFKDNDWIQLSNSISKVSFDKPSTYAGSDKKYSSIFYREDGFYLEDGILAIPRHIFMKYLKENKGVKVIF